MARIRAAADFRSGKRRPNGLFDPSLSGGFTLGLAGRFGNPISDLWMLPDAGDRRHGSGHRRVASIPTPAVPRFRLSCGTTKRRPTLNSARSPRPVPCVRPPSRAGADASRSRCGKASFTSVAMILSWTVLRRSTKALRSHATPRRVSGRSGARFRRNRHCRDRFRRHELDLWLKNTRFQLEMEEMDLLPDSVISHI